MMKEQVFGICAKKKHFCITWNIFHKKNGSVPVKVSGVNVNFSSRVWWGHFKGDEDKKGRRGIEAKLEMKMECVMPYLILPVSHQTLDFAPKSFYA